MKKRGLTLIEVMLALTILGVGLSVLIATASKCLAVIRQSKNYENARHLLAIVEIDFHNKLLELEEDGELENLEDGSEAVDFPYEFSNYKGSWEVTTIGEEEDGLKQISFRVTWSERGKESFEEVTMYRYVPQKVKG